ncbi:MAG: GAF domain-containing protein [Chloroflexota bacterium]
MTARLLALARAGQAFAEAGLDEQAILDVLLREVLVAVGDIGVVRLRTDDGAAFISAPGVAPVGLEADDLLRHLLDLSFADEDSLVAQVVQTGAPARADTIDTSVLLTSGLGQDAVETLDSVPIGGLIGVPIRARGAVLGVLVALRVGLDRSYADEDELLAQELADRAGLAVEQARLYRFERRMRQQNGLLATAGRRLAESLDPTATLRAVAESIVPDLADWCIIDMIADDGTVERAAVAHADPSQADVAARLMAYPPDLSRPDGGADALRTGQSELDTAVTDDVLRRIARNDEHLALLRAFRPVSHLRTPLIARGRILGSLLLVSGASGHRYNADDLALAEELAGRCALAIDNAQLHTAEERARERAAALAEAAQTLAEAGAAPDQVLPAVADLAARLIGDLAIVRLLSEDGKWLEIAAVGHPDGAALREARAALAQERHPADAGANGAALGTGTPQRLAGSALDALQRRSDSQLWPDVPGAPTAALLAVPLRAEGRVIGTLSLSRSDPERTYTAADELFLQDLADRAALAVERARLYASERQTRERAAFLAEASAILATDLEYTSRLTALTRLVVPILADWSVVDLLNDDGSLQRLTAVHADPSLQPVADTLVRSYPTLTAGASHTITRVLASGTSWIDPQVGRERFESEARDPGHLALIECLGFGSEMVVPLVARGRSLGTITLVFGPSGRRHTREDLTLAEDLAGRAALALDNARLHEATLASEKRFRALFEGTADASLVVDASGGLLELNQAVVTLTGYGPAELREMNVFDLLADPLAGEAELARLDRDGSSRGDLEMRRRDGTTVPVEVQSTAVDLPDGRIYILAMRDIRERRALERLQQELLATVTHDLKNPLASISGHAQLLRRRQAYGERSVDTILSESRRLGRLIDDLLDVTRAEAGQLTLVRDWDDLLAAVQAAVQAAQAVSTAHRVQLTSPEGPLVAFIDRDRVEQVVQNLLLNAIKYSPDGGPVQVRVDDDGEELRITVTDQGIGIEPEILPQLFGRFYRSPSARERRLPGLGLGLYVTRSLVEAHGGRIWAESGGRGQGSRFVVALPAQPQEPVVRPAEDVPDLGARPGSTRRGA